MHTRDSKLNNIVSKVPQVTLGGAAIMTIAGILFFSRDAIMASNRRRCVRHYWLFLLRK